MSKVQVTVKIDTREVDDIINKMISEAQSHSDVREIHPEHLPAGDLDIAGVGFERKTVSDYVSSLQEGRIDEQTTKLDQYYERAYILVDGDLVETNSPFRSGMDPASIRGSMAALTAREDSGVHAVIPVSNTALLFDMAVRLARKEIEVTEDNYLPTGDVDTSHPTALQQYGCLPGIGPAMAERIYEEYPSMTDFVRQATIEDLMDIEGIGRSTAMKIIMEMT